MSAAPRALTVEQVLARLSSPAPTLILFHVNPDADAIGSAFALASFLSACGSSAYCLCADEIPERLRFLTDGLQDSVLISSLPEGFEDARVITVDSASPAQLGSLYDTLGERVSLMIDHHAAGTPYADYLLVPQAAATGEILFDLFAASGLDLPAVTAKLLYSAISSDTGGFRYANVRKETHLRAAALVEAGVDVAEVSRLLFETKSPATLRAERLGLSKLQVLDGGRVAVITVSYAELQENDLRPEHLATLIDIARSVAGVEVAAVLRQLSDQPVFRLSTRANVDFDVSAVCATFGGGGHRRAAGATLHADCMESALSLLLSAIEAQRP